MKQQAILLTLLFLLTFGPKIGGWIDIVSITAVVPIAIHFLYLNTAHIPPRVRHKFLLLLSIFLFVLLYATVHFFLQHEGNPYQVLRFGRVVVNFVAVAALVSIYYRAYGLEARTVISRHVFHCLVLHAMIMVAMFASPPFRHVVVNHVVQADPDSRTYTAKESGYRIAGLTDSWDALSGLESFGLLMLPILLTRQATFPRIYAAFSLPILLFAVAISGRTGIVTAAILLPLSLCFVDLRKTHRTLLVGAFLAPLFLIISLGSMRDSLERAIHESSLARTLSVFGLTAESGQNNTLQDTFASIRDHYFLPDSAKVLVFGTGGSGRDSWDYVVADNGLILNLHNLGAIGFLLIYGSLIAMLVSALSLRKADPASAGFAVLAVALILLIDAKVLYVLARNGFSVMMTVVLVAWWELEWVNARVLANGPLRSSAAHVACPVDTISPRGSNSTGAVAGSYR